ncbi:MAG: VWA domain-containing protein [Actinomycetia bacterium]|nr:VWA domain-containing protein [Actinomycetes bacterium]
MSRSSTRGSGARMINLRPVAIMAAIMAIVCLAVAPSAFAQDGNEGAEAPIVRRIDATADGSTLLTLVDANAQASLNDVAIQEEGAEVQISGISPVSGSDTPVYTAIVFDTSDLMTRQDAYDGAKAAVEGLVSSKADNERYALVVTGGGARVVEGFTLSGDTMLEAIDRMDPVGRSALYDGVSVAVELFRSSNTFRPGEALGQILVVAGSGDELSQAGGFSIARGGASAEGLLVLAAGFEGSGSNPANALREFIHNDTTGTGGAYRGAAEGSGIGEAVTGIGSLIRSQYVVDYVPTTDEPGGLDLTVSVGGASTGVSFTNEASTNGVAALRPAEIVGGKGLAIFQQPMGLYAGLGMVLLAAGMAVYALGVLFAGGESRLDSMLANYADGFDVERPGEYVDEEEDQNSGALLERAFAITEGFAERQGLLARAEKMLEKADMPLRAGEALFFYVTIVMSMVIGVGFITVAFGGGLNPMLILIMALLGLLLPPAFVNFKAGRRQKAFVAQLPDTLQLLSGTLKAGYSLQQGFEATSHEVIDPMGSELRRVMTEARLGRDLEDALESAADRLESDDFAWAVMAIKIQREVGGNLAELLMTVAETMQARDRLRGEVAALTAEGKVSAIVLGLLPVGLGFAMWMINPDYINLLITNRTGNFMLGGAITLALVGFAWMKKVISIEI